jgi:hypothetical protein
MGTSTSKSGENHPNGKESSGFYQLSQPLQSQQQQQDNGDRERLRSLGKNSKEIKRQYHDKFIKDAKEVSFLLLSITEFDHCCCFLRLHVLLFMFGAFLCFFVVVTWCFCLNSLLFSILFSLLAFLSSRIFIKEIKCFVKLNLIMQNNIIIILWKN